MDKLIKVSVIVLVASLAAGCGAIQNKVVDLASVNSVVANKKLSSPPSQSCWIKLAAKESAGTAICGSGDAKPAECPSGYDKKACRDFIQDQIFNLSEELCTKHKAAIYGNASALNTSLGFANLVTAGVASVVTGGSTNTWAAIATLAGGTRELVNTEIYQGKLVPAIIAEIKSNRESIKESIVRSRGVGISDYTPGAAISDALKYHSECSFFAGVSSLVEKAGETEQYSGAWAAENVTIFQNKISEIKKELASAGISAARKSVLNIKLDDYENMLLYMQTLQTATTYRGASKAGEEGSKKPDGG